MKKTILITALLVAGTLHQASAQQLVAPATPRQLSLKGSYNSTTMAGGTVADTNLTTWNGASQGTLYTRKDTVTNSGTTTFKERIPIAVNSVYTWCHAEPITGTNTSGVFELYVTGGSGTNYMLDPVKLYTVAATGASQTVSYLFNSGVGFPWSTFFWKYVGGGTHTTSWWSGVTIK